MTSKIKVDNINKVSDDSNIINKCGTTITLGASGDSIALASGASQTGFGRTGTVDWQTGSIKTTNFTAVDGQGFFVDTNGGEVTATLPTGSAGSIVSIQDYRNTFDNNNCTVQTAGSQKINGGTAGGKVILSTEGEGITLVYIDSTIGWRSIQDNDFASASITPTFITATGGTITCSGNCKIHTFTGPGTFCVSGLSNVAANNEVSYVVVAGGGGSAGFKPCSPAAGSGGGGAGGYRETKSPVTPYTASPLDGYSTPGNRITATVANFPIAVGGGGAPGPRQSPGGQGTAGGVATFSTITSAGGGGGSNYPGPGVAGGSGGGGRGGGGGPCEAGGAGNTPPTTPAQGFAGGQGGATGTGGGGGGATAVGTAGLVCGCTTQGGPGGAGATSSITGSPVARAGGGGGSTGNAPSANPGGVGGAGGGGNGGVPGSIGQCGTANTGGGAGGAKSLGSCEPGTNGGSGIVIIRYKRQ
jgi:hypothetical protein